MKQGIKVPVLSLSLLVLLAVGPAPQAPLGVSLVQEAAAVVGVPWSPASFAGVARRTTRRAVVATSAAASAQQAAQPQAAAPQPTAAPQPAGAPPLGSIVATLPAGCVTSPKGGVQYYDCNGVYYRAAFQGNNLVYVVTQP